MSFSEQFPSVSQPSDSSKGGRRAQARINTYRPRFEALEDRCTPNLMGPAPPGSELLVSVAAVTTADDWADENHLPFRVDGSNRLAQKAAFDLKLDVARKDEEASSGLKLFASQTGLLPHGMGQTHLQVGAWEPAAPAAQRHLFPQGLDVTPLSPAAAEDSGSPGVASASEYFVSPQGTPAGDGSFESPWDLATALAHPPAVQPGATIWLLGGTYQGAFTSNLTGTADAPIIVRQYPGERAVIDGASSDSPVTVHGAWTWYWGFEVMSSDPDRPVDDEYPSNRGTAFTVFGQNTKFINLVVHDNAQGFGFWTPAEDAELYGNLIYNNGWEGNLRGHGHGIYTQNRFGTKHIRDNILFNQFGRGIAIFGSEVAYLNNYLVEGNISFNNGALSARSGFSSNLLMGGGRLAENHTVRANSMYYPPSATKGDNLLGYREGCRDLNVEDNYFVGGQYALSLGDVNRPCENVAMTGNTLYGPTWGFTENEFPDNTYYRQRPRGVAVSVRANEYEAGRAHIAVYNWDLLNTVVVDVSQFGLESGTPYELRNVQNYDGAVVKGTYEGVPIQVPMTDLTVAKPIGWPAPASSLPEFGAFVFTVTA